MSSHLNSRLEELLERHRSILGEGALEVLHVQDRPDGTCYILARTGRELTLKDVQKLAEARPRTVLIPISNPDQPDIAEGSVRSDHDLSPRDLHKENQLALRGMLTGESIQERVARPNDGRDQETSFFQEMYRRLWGKQST